MKKLLLILLASWASVSFAQDTRIPTNEKSGLAEYVGVEEVSSTSAQELYDRALNWIEEYYPNPSGVIKSMDSSAMEITGRARFRLTRTDKKGVTAHIGIVTYNLTLQFKDGRYRYVIDHIGWKQSSYFDVSRWEDPSENDYQEETWPDYVDQTITYFTEMIESMNEFLSTAPEEEDTSW